MKLLSFAEKIRVVIFWDLAIGGFLYPFFFAGCASLPQAHSNYAIVHALPVQKGDDGFYFDTENRDYMLHEGVPATLFASTPRGWYLSRLNEIKAANIIYANENPIIWKGAP